MKILCCGDSHIEVFGYCNKKQNNFVFDVCKVGGATAQGAVNPNSKTETIKDFEKHNNKRESIANPMQK